MKTYIGKFTCLLVASWIVGLHDLYGQTLSDTNGDGTIQIVALGDSLTYGVGNGIAPNEEVTAVSVPELPSGYPEQLEVLIGIPVVNRGVPGEALADGGLVRFIREAVPSRYDAAILFEGENDALSRLSQLAYERLVQVAINVLSSRGLSVVLATLPPPCCDRVSRLPFVTTYNRSLRFLAEANGVALVDIDEMWQKECPDPESCPLVNRPEGLHPNTLGYKALTQLFAASLLDIPLYDRERNGPQELADAVGLDISDIILGR